MNNETLVAPVATQAECVSVTSRVFPFKEEFKNDPCLVSVCFGGINNTWITYPFTPMEAVANYIRDPYYMGQLTADIRAAVEADDKVAKDHYKSELPYMMFPSLAERRRTEFVIRPNGLFGIDIDHMSNFQKAEELKRALFEDENLDVRLAFVSPSGRGVKAIIRRPLNLNLSITEAQIEGQTSINEYYNATYSNTYGAAADPCGKDLVRTCYLCHDPNVLFKK